MGVGHGTASKPVSRLSHWALLLATRGPRSPFPLGLVLKQEKGNTQSQQTPHLSREAPAGTLVWGVSGGGGVRGGLAECPGPADCALHGRHSRESSVGTGRPPAPACRGHGEGAARRRPLGTPSLPTPHGTPRGMRTTCPAIPVTPPRAGLPALELERAAQQQGPECPKPVPSAACLFCRREPPGDHSEGSRTEAVGTRGSRQQTSRFPNLGWQRPALHGPQVTGHQT